MAHYLFFDSFESVSGESAWHNRVAPFLCAPDASGNDPCPCGSGKKYKKCCWSRDHAGYPGDMIDRAISWVLDQPELGPEVDKYMDENADAFILSDEDVANNFDLFLFDYKLKDGKTPLRHFMDYGGLMPEEHALCKKLEENKFSVFEAIDVRAGGGIILRDMVGGGEYFAREKRGSARLLPGDMIACRIVPFRSDFMITTPSVRIWPGEERGRIEETAVRLRSRLAKGRLGGNEVLDALSEWDGVTRTLDEAKAALKKKLDGAGLKLDFRTLSRRINESKSPNEAFPEIYEHRFPSGDDFNEAIELLSLVWNKHPRREFGGKSPEDISSYGPLETALINTFMEDSYENVDIDSYPTAAKAEEAVERFREKWLKTPQKKLKGKTPMERILEERELLGNPKKDFSIRMEIKKVAAPLNEAEWRHIDAKAAEITDKKQLDDLLYHIRTNRCPYNKQECKPKNCPYGMDGIEECPVHRGEKT
ncbi:MAG: hypothetical protein CVT48_06060 [Thermoplasmata archaeon HGW-Thermoplasmata-1]|nr:MAG: hypothetical protein CVT48_06060 [Thermoplasmata archaeon HGW-Thermoplasmata-1]